MLSTGTPARMTRSTSSDNVYMAYVNEHTQEHRLKRDEIMTEVTDGAGESTKIPGFSKHFKRSMRTLMMSLDLTASTGGILDQQDIAHYRQVSS